MTVVRESNQLDRPGVRLLGVLTLALAITLTGIFAFGPSAAHAKFKQPGCAKFKKKMKKAKSKAAKQRLKRAFKQCKANRKVYSQVRNSHFVGANERGERIDLVFCANGRFVDSYGEIYRKGWRITGAKVRGKNFTAAYEALIGRSKVGSTKQIQVSTWSGSLVKQRGKWLSGIEIFGKPDRLGPVTKSSAKKECRKL